MTTIKLGKIYGNKKVLACAAKRGKIAYYTVRCERCGFECLMHEESIKRGLECEKCRLRKLRKVFNLTINQSFKKPYKGDKK